jgi:myo-inositol-1(or 4)-monophosphatase
MRVLLEAYPTHSVLAEESGARGESEFQWIIDPLDGTTNFIHGFPVYAVSIALAFRGQVQQGVVYDPNRNDLFYASKGRGAFLNDKRLRVSKRTRLADSLIGTGFPFRKGDNFKRYMKIFEEVMQNCAGLRRPGSAALDLCYVAAGWYDGFFETGLNAWDVAAGSLMVTEAGGLIGNFTGDSDFMYQREAIAANPKVYAQLVQMLGPYSHVIKADERHPAATEAAAQTTPEAALAQSLSADTQADRPADTPAAATAAAPGEEAKPRKPPLRIRKDEMAREKAAAERAAPPRRGGPRKDGNRR